MKALFSNKLRVFLLLLVLLIALILSSIFIIDLKSNKTNVKINSSLKGYVEVKSALSNLSKTPEIQADSQYSRVIERFNSLENSNLNSASKYSNLREAFSFLTGLYLSTNNHDVYLIFPSFTKLAEDNFKEFKKEDFAYDCQDPTCADTPMPQEIKDVISQIEKLNFNENSKKGLIQNIKSSSYVSSNLIELRVANFLTDAEILRLNPFLKELKQNDILADKIVSYVKNTYPKEYEKLNKPELK